MTNLAKVAFGTMQALKGFFARLGKAGELKLKRLSEQFKLVLGRTNEPSRAIITEIDNLKEETEEFYAVKNFVENLPSNLTPPEYFELSMQLLRKLGRASDIMERNKLYTFKYIAQTPGKYYDVFPVIMLDKVNTTFYQGFNFHWERAPEYVESVYRTYKFSRVQTKFYKILPHELEYFLQIPTFMPIFIPFSYK
jgi:hypothetical protein